MMYGLSLVPVPQAKSFAVVPSQDSPDSPEQSSSSDLSVERLDELFSLILLLELTLFFLGPFKEAGSSSSVDETD